MAGDIGIQEAAIVFPAGQATADIDRRGPGGQRYGSRVLIAALSQPEADSLRARFPTAAIHLDSDTTGQIAVEEQDGLTDEERRGLAAFDLRRSAGYAARKAARPLDGANWGSAEPPDPPRTAPGLASGFDPALAGTSERLIGSVGIGLIIVEGPASAGLTFTDAETVNAIAEVQNAASWLGNARLVTPISWSYQLRDIKLTVPPNPKAPDLEAVWRDPTLAALGYPPGLAGMQQYVNDLRNTLVTQWAYCAFIIKYPANHFAYAYPGGPGLVMQYSNDGWGPDNIDRVFAHETGHIFGAPDEYDSSKCNCGGSFGFFGVPNLNCENCAPGGSDTCIMSHNAWAMCTYTPRHIGTRQWNIGRNTTASPPFVANGVCYFQGTDNKLWRVDAQTGRNQQQINNNTIQFSPFVYKDVVYFQGSDNKLWRVNIDGTNQQQINNNTTWSPPFVSDDVVYFRGTGDSKLWRVNIDGTNQKQINGNTTQWSPFVADGVVYFVGTDSKLWRANIDGTNQQQINGNTALGAPFVVDGVAYFRGIDYKLWRVNIDGTNQQQINGNTTKSIPFVADGVVYFQGTGDYKLWRVNIDGTNQQQINGNTTWAAPFVADDVVYFMGTGDYKLWMVSTQ